MKGTRRGIALNSRATAAIDSHLADFKEDGADSQAICGWNGPGPFKIVNNYREGMGENVMFGGADPSIRDLVPTGIEIRRNHFAKPLERNVPYVPARVGVSVAGKATGAGHALLRLAQASRVSYTTAFGMSLAELEQACRRLG